MGIGDLHICVKRVMPEPQHPIEDSGYQIMLNLLQIAQLRTLQHGPRFAQGRFQHCCCQRHFGFWQDTELLERHSALRLQRVFALAFVPLPAKPVICSKSANGALTSSAQSNRRAVYVSLLVNASRVHYITANLGPDSAGPVSSIARAITPSFHFPSVFPSNKTRNK